MPCYHPLRVALDDEGRLDFSIYSTVSPSEETVLVPCRKCIGCTAGQAREWSIRCFHESLHHQSLYRDPHTGVSTKLPNSVCLTLTYDDEHLPAGSLLKPSDFTNFMRRLRNSRPKSPRYFMAGEYGGLTQRPHFHSLIFGEMFHDRYHITTSDQQQLSCSYHLDELWGKGRATIDDLTFGSVRYVTGYITKKANANGNFTGPLLDLVNEVSGEVVVRPASPEYRHMSRNPGIGKAWIKANYDRVYADDSIEIQGQTFPPPGYYDRWLKRHDAVLYREVQSRRLDDRIRNQIAWDRNRCGAAETIHAQRLRKDSL